MNPFDPASWTPETHRVNRLAAASCVVWWLLTACVHLLTPLVVPAYRAWKPAMRVEWCNRAVSTVHALLIIPLVLPGLADERLLANPIFEINDAVMTYCPIVFGYFIYDLMFTIVYYRWSVCGGFLSADDGLIATTKKKKKKKIFHLVHMSLANAFKHGPLKTQNSKKKKHHAV
jgi:hypothetical protein